MASTRYSYRQHVEQKAGVKSGSPCVAGTGIRAIHVLRLYRDRGLTASEIAAELDLPLASVHGALAFALDNEEMLDVEERRREAWVAKFASGHSSVSA